jgi:hypothetical protein
MEMHLVHWNTGYGNIQEASSKRDGLGVLGLLFDTEQSSEAEGSGVRVVSKHLARSINDNAWKSYLIMNPFYDKQRSKFPNLTF